MRARSDSTRVNCISPALRSTMTAPMLSPPLTIGMAITGPVPGVVAIRDRVLPPGFGVEVADEDLTGVHGATARRIAHDDRLLDIRMSVDDAQAARVEQADHDPFGTEQLGDVSQQALVEDLGLLDSPAQAIDRHTLPRRKELSELIDLVAERDTRGGLVGGRR